MKQPIRVTLPDNHNEKDAEWIASMLEQLPPHLRFKATEGYSRTYNEAFNAESSEVKKLNAARREANIRLRHFVQRCARAALGECAKPPVQR